MSEYIENYLSDLRGTLDRLPIAGIQSLADLLHHARMDGRRVFIMGNGGSAATASHFVCDLAKNTRNPDLPDFKVVGLADNMAIFSAFGNDEGYENVFAGQLRSLVQVNDVVIAISASGNSLNVLRAVEVANAAGACTVGFTGYDGGKLGHMVNLNLHIPSHWIEQVEDIHLMLEHILIGELRIRARQTLSELQPSAIETQRVGADAD